MVIAALELRGALAQRRLFFFNTLVPLALVLPIAVSAAPRVHAALVYTLLFTFFGVFGHAIPLARDAERGLTARWLLTGMAPQQFFAQRIAAHTVIDLVQLLPALLIIALLYGAGPAALGGLAAAALLALLAANAIGAVIATLARSIAEAALFAAITALFALHAAGVFRTPVSGSPAERLRLVAPFARLHESVRTTMDAPLDPVPYGWTWSLIATGAGLTLILLCAPLLARMLTRTTAD